MPLPPAKTIPFIYPFSAPCGSCLYVTLTHAAAYAFITQIYYFCGDNPNLDIASAVNYANCCLKSDASNVNMSEICVIVRKWRIRCNALSNCVLIDSRGLCR